MGKTEDITYLRRETQSTLLMVYLGTNSPTREPFFQEKLIRLAPKNDSNPLSLPFSSHLQGFI